MKLEVGSKVRLVDDWSFTGTVQEIPSYGSIKVKWDKRSHCRLPESFDTEELRLVDVEAEKAAASRIQDKLDEAASAFEKAFKAYSDANDLVNELGTSIYSLEDDEIISMKKLENVINENGWSVSSLRC